MGKIVSQFVGHLHYGLTEAEMQRKTESNGNFHGPLPICGNGSWHASTTRNIKNLTCEACKAALAKNPNFLKGK